MNSRISSSSRTTTASILFAAILLISVVVWMPTIECVEQTEGHVCKELNQVNCFMSANQGSYCNSKNPTKTQTRWYYDKGTCRNFNYRGCNGNRNRFCTKQSCEQRCGRA